MDDKIHVEDTIMVFEELLKAGLHEGAKVIQLYVLAEDCNQPDYFKLMYRLCASRGVGLFNGSQYQDSWGVG